MKQKYLIILCLIVLISFSTTQLTNDFFVFWAYGRFVYNSSAHGIEALIDTWEMKGLLFKSFLAGEYAITSFFSTDFSLLGQFIYKFFGLIIYLPILGLVIYVLPQQYLANRANKVEAFCYTSIFLLAVHFCSHFQGEMWGVLFVLLSLSLYLRGNILSKIMAAIIYSLSFYLKSPIPLLGGSLFFGALLLKSKSFKTEVKEILPFVITSTIVLFASLTAVYTFYPQEFYDILSASQFQHTLFNPEGSLFMSLAHCIYGIILSILYHPIVFIGIILSVMLISRWWKEKAWKKIVSIVGVWFFPLFYVLLSNCYFAYHYYLLSFSSIITILVFLDNGFRLSPLNKSCVIAVYIIYYLLALSSVCPTNISEKINYTKVWNDNKIEKDHSYYVGCILGEEKILFLDDGTGAFVFSNPSYLRYFYPLPLQRIKRTDKYAKTQAYDDIKKKALSYDGQYITLFSEWFMHGDNEDIIEKINKEYELYDEIKIPRFAWSLFTWVSPESTQANSKLLLYKRK